MGGEAVLGCHVPRLRGHVDCVSMQYTTRVPSACGGAFPAVHFRTARPTARDQGWGETARSRRYSRINASLPGTLANVSRPERRNRESAPTAGNHREMVAPRAVAPRMLLLFARCALAGGKQHRNPRFCWPQRTPRLTSLFSLSFWERAGVRAAEFAVSRFSRHWTRMIGGSNQRAFPWVACSTLAWAWSSSMHSHCITDVDSCGKTNLEEPVPSADCLQVGRQ
jgi:hypothetical protein